MDYRHVRSKLIAFLCTALAAGIAAAQSLEIIELHHRSAEEIIPLVRPLLDGGAALSGQDYKLFVRTSAGNLADIRRVIAEIDRAPRQLRVSVRQATREEISREALSASGTVRVGDAHVAINSPPRDASGVTVRATDDATRSRDESVASVLVLDGVAAHIATGERVPVITAVAVRGGRRPLVATAGEYQDLTSGYTVTPRVNGQRVVLEVSHRGAARDTGNASTIVTSDLTTSVSGALGEWLELGRIESSTETRERGIAAHSYATQSDSRGLWIRVESVAD